MLDGPVLNNGSDLIRDVQNLVFLPGPKSDNVGFECHDLSRSGKELRVKDQKMILELSKGSGVKDLYVKKIRNGSVIDHISAGHALDVLKILGIGGGEGAVTDLLNVEVFAPASLGQF